MAITKLVLTPDLKRKLLRDRYFYCDVISERLRRATTSDTIKRIDCDIQSIGLQQLHVEVATVWYKPVAPKTNGSEENHSDMVFIDARML